MSEQEKNVTSKPEAKASKPEAKPAPEAPAQPTGVTVRFKAASKGRKRGDTETVAPDVAERLIANGHATRV